MFSSKGYPKLRQVQSFSYDFLLLFCEKNSDGTKKFRFKGNELFQRFRKRLFTEDLELICNFLKNHLEITEIDLSYNKIDDKGLEIFCNKILKDTNYLEALNLGNCNITEEGMQSFYNVALEKKLQLKTLRLRGNKIGPRGGYLVALAIPFIPSLEYLDLGDTDQTVSSIDAINENTYPSAIKVLNISRVLPNSSLQQVNSEILSTSLCELLRRSKLVELHIQKFNLDYDNIGNLLYGLECNTTLKFLDLGYNQLHCNGVEVLSRWLKSRPQLLGLNLAGNAIGNHGGVALSFALPFSKLRFLDLSDNRIGDEGLEAILFSIKKVYRMRRLMIWGNQIGTKTLKILERMFRSGVFEQENIDVKISEVDGNLEGARFLINNSKNCYYGITEFGCAQPIKIKKYIPEKRKNLLPFTDIEGCFNKN